MSGTRAAYLAGRREIRERMRSRTFRISTALQVVVVIAIVVVGSLLTDNGPDKATVGTAGPAAGAAVASAQHVQAGADLEIEARQVRNEAMVRRSIRNDDLDAGLVGRRLLIGEGAPDALEPLLLQASSTTGLRSGLQRAGVGSTAADRVIAAGAVTPIQVEGDDSDGGQGIAFLSTLLLYLAIIMSGYSVSSGVVEEKSTRVVELLLNAIRPRQLLAGKVFGIGLIGLFQLLAIVIAGLAAALLIGSVDLPSATTGTVLLSLLYFVLGFAFYGCAFAVAGSIVSRQEDMQSTTAPLMIMLIVGYLASIAVIDSPGSTAATVLTLLPPAAPMIVPARAAAGELPLPELLASIALMVAASAILISIAGRIYERAVLRMGSPLKLREAFGLLRAGG